MTDPHSERAVDEDQREAERAALRKVRAALDEIGRQQEHRKFGWFALVVSSVVIVVLVVGSVLALSNAKRASEKDDRQRVRLSTSALQYSLQVENRIRTHLNIPGGVPSTASTVVELTLSEAGAVADSKIVKSSGISAYDEAVRQAVSHAGPFAPIPVSADVPKPLRMRMEFRARDSR